MLAEPLCENRRCALVEPRPWKNRTRIECPIVKMDNDVAINTELDARFEIKYKSSALINSN
jgi:hypothetical protein